MRPTACVIGPYMGKYGQSVKPVTSKEVQTSINDHIQQARQVSKYLWSNGYYVFCSHLNTSHFELYSIPEIHFIDFNRKLIQQNIFDLYVVFGDYTQSVHTLEEIELIRVMQKPLFYYDQATLSPLNPETLDH